MNKKKILAIFLYCLPAIFLVAAYFGITASGEDIFQGAGNWRNGVEVNVWEDATDAFSHNGRLTDVYAWTVIDFFDYQFQFGPDVIFRLLDLMMAGGIFYMMALIAMERRPRLAVRDALIFDAVSIMVMSTQHGRVFYAGFSAIHNYMVAIFIMLLFCLPYLMMVLGKNVERMKAWWMQVGFLILGVIFGMSAALPPVAFLVIVAVCIVIKWVKKMKFVFSWVLLGAVGVLIGVLCSNFLGPGVDFYTSNDIYVSAYDYVPVGDLLADPAGEFWRICEHVVVNFGRVLVPLLVFAACGLAFSRDSWMIFKKKTWRKMNNGKKRFLEISGFFVMLNVLLVSQVNAPLRILLPAYVTGVVMVTMIFEPYVKSRVLGWAIGVAVIVLTVVKIGFTGSYHTKMEVVLDEIENSDSAELCIDQERIRAKNLPVVYLGQEDMLADWAMPEVVYGRTVKFCD